MASPEDDAFTALNMDQLVDPLEAVEPSEIGHGQAEESLVDPEEGVSKVQGQHLVLANHSLAASASVIQLTAAGVRSFLGRTHRPRPLLQLTCKGCLKTTHDVDPFVDEDYLERLVSTQTQSLDGYSHGNC